MAEAGVASRRACEELILSGVVKVNGEKVTVPQTRVSRRKDKVSPLLPPPHLHLLLI
jgi:23S rRNA pseudouridine2605 synthase